MWVPPDQLPGRQPLTQKQHHGQHHWHPWLQQTGLIQAGFAPRSNSPSHRQLFHLLSTVSGVFSRLNTSTLSISSFHTRLIFKNPALKDLPVSQANLKPSLILPLGHQQILLLLTPKVLWSLAASHHTHHSHCGHTQPYTPMAVLLCWGPLYGLLKNSDLLKTEVTTSLVRCFAFESNLNLFLFSPKFHSGSFLSQPVCSFSCCASHRAPLLFPPQYPDHVPSAYHNVPNFPGAAIQLLPRGFPHTLKVDCHSALQCSWPTLFHHTCPWEGKFHRNDTFWSGALLVTQDNRNKVR